nr:hypothetical protein Iba_chr15cCG1860 [Ipomoea batatas]
MGFCIWSVWKYHLLLRVPFSTAYVLPDIQEKNDRRVPVNSLCCRPVQCHAVDLLCFSQVQHHPSHHHKLLWLFH